MHWVVGADAARDKWLRLPGDRQRTAATWGASVLVWLPYHHRSPCAAMLSDVRLVATVSAVSQEDTGEGTRRAAPRGRDGVWDAQPTTKREEAG